MEGTGCTVWFEDAVLSIVSDKTKTLLNRVSVEPLVKSLLWVNNPVYVTFVKYTGLTIQLKLECFYISRNVNAFIPDGSVSYIPCSKY